MNTTLKQVSVLVFLALNTGLYLSCQQLGLTKEKTDNTPLIAAAVLASRTTTASACSGGTSTGSTITLSSATIETAASGCVNGVTTSMDSSLPSWIKDNFKCSIAFTSGTSLCFKSKNLPNTKSSYYGTSSTLYEARTTTGTNPNSIASQNLVYSIPATPTKGTGTVSTQGGLSSIGITLNGLAIFNNAAAPPDVLATEATTFDNYQGHPEKTGVYHHHAAVPKVCGDGATTSNTGACASSSLIGIALDGYAIYAQKCDKGTSSTTDDAAPTDLDSLHGHTAVTTHFTTATYHYHYANDTTATIYTLMGSFFYGTIGSISN